MKKVKVPLSVKGLKDLSKNVRGLKKDFKDLDTRIVEQLSDFTLQEIQKNFSATIYKDGNDDVSFFERGTSKKKIVGMMGTQVLYDEFGTGTEGQKSPHPLKEKYGLKPYNNRANTTIRTNNSPNSTASQFGIPLGALYWTYNDGGVKVYTTGIPAGNQVYNASVSLRKKKMEIIKKEVSDVLSKL